MSHKPPKNDVERLANLIEGLLDFDEDELPPLEETNAMAAAAGIDFDAWGEKIRKMAQAKLREQQAARIAAALAERDAELAKIADRPRPSGTRDEKLAWLRALADRPGGEGLAAHFKKLEDASDEALDELIVSAANVIERAKKRGDG